jgi:hypothetical protein
MPGHRSCLVADLHKGAIRRYSTFALEYTSIDQNIWGVNAASPTQNGGSPKLVDKYPRAEVTRAAQDFLMCFVHMQAQPGACDCDWEAARPLWHHYEAPISRGEGLLWIYRLVQTRSEEKRWVFG